MKLISAVFLLIELLGSRALAVKKEYLFDLTKSEIRIEFLALGNPSALRIKGKVKEEKALTGSLTIRGNQVTGSAKLMLNLLDTGMELRNEHMKKKYLEIEKYPNANLEIKSLLIPAEMNSQDFSKIDTSFSGDLSLHGTKKPVTGKVTVEKNGERLELAFHFKISNKDFDIETPHFMGITVADEVEVSVEVNGMLSNIKGETL